MRRLNPLLILVLGVLLIQIKALVTSGTFDQWCPSTAILSVSSQDKTSPMPLRFDWVSYYENTDKESATLVVQGGDGTNDYTYVTVLKDGSIDTVRKCTGSATYTFVSLVNNYLTLSTIASTPAYYVCKCSPGSDATPTLFTTSGLTSLVKFTPYMASGNTIYTLARDSTSTKMVYYVYPALTANLPRNYHKITQYITSQQWLWIQQLAPRLICLIQWALSFGIIQALDGSQLQT